LMKEDWERFLAEKRQKNGQSDKSFDHYSEYSFIRARLAAKDNPATNIDFLLKHIMTRMPKDKRKKRKIAKVFNLLLKMKTEELVLWNIAKDYWHKAAGSKYQLEQLKTERNSSNFQDFCSFNKVYKQDLDYKFVIDGDFWTEKHKKKFDTAYKCLQQGAKTIEFSIKVPARRYDNKFIMYETSLIKEYMIWYHFDERKQRINQHTEYKHRDGNIKRTFDLTQYDDIMKLVNKELIQSIKYIGKLLRAEKKIVDSNQSKYLGLLDTKYANQDVIKTFYLAVTDKNCMPEDKQLFEAFLMEAKGDKALIEDYLVLFRNYALHYQLQDPKKVGAVLRFLEAINKDVDKDEYVTEE